MTDYTNMLLCFRPHFCGYVREGDEENVTDSTDNAAGDDFNDHVEGANYIRFTLSVKLVYSATC